MLHNLWDRTFGAHPQVWGAVLGVGYEAVIGVSALSRNPRRRLLGLSGVVLFKLGLLALGLWWWALPWLAVLIPTIVFTAGSPARLLAGPVSGSGQVHAGTMTSIPGG
ncbi:hypothetical protein LSI54_09345 [Nesterenkonia sp. AY15]|uniref:hypothetical protein n=1 Tax=Nesterenkonia sp. AY15 TaxID=2901139 RepID=UPI001F4D2A8D|nr:hypothetical protein [Nesterenkonia sp. AY15]MCH8571555.1 hypothetical protein [Nesterenkonia sp. AY15]